MDYRNKADSERCPDPTSLAARHSLDTTKTDGLDKFAIDDQTPSLSALRDSLDRTVTLLLPI
jgi:hypothetical protein